MWVFRRPCKNFAFSMSQQGRFYPLFTSERERKSISLTAPPKSLAAASPQRPSNWRRAGGASVVMGREKERDRPKRKWQWVGGWIRLQLALKISFWMSFFSPEHVQIIDTELKQDSKCSILTVTVMVLRRSSELMPLIVRQGQNCGELALNLQGLRARAYRY